MTLEELIAAEDRAFAAWIAVADTMGLERYDSNEYKTYIRACKAVNAAVINNNRAK